MTKPISETERLGWPQAQRRTWTNAAEYASPITRYVDVDSGHRFVLAFCTVGLCVVVALLLAGWM